MLNMASDIIDIQEKKEAFYRTMVRPRLMEELKDKIIEQLLVQKKFRQQGYTARQLADELQTNVRYVSAVIRAQFHTNYTTLVNKYRVEEAMRLLNDSRYDHLGVEEIGYMVGFLHRQSFHTAFLKYVGRTPRDYRQNCENLLPPPKYEPKHKTKK